MKEVMIKAYAYDSIKWHLKRARKDHRQKERMRARIAQRHIAAWFKEGKRHYESLVPPARIQPAEATGAEG